MGFPKSDSESVVKAATLIARAFKLNSGGGNLHIVLEDWNLEDVNVEWCRNMIAERRAGTWRVPKDWPKGFNDAPPQLKMEAELGDLLISMTEADRGAAIARAEGWTDEKVAAQT